MAGSARLYSAQLAGLPILDLSDPEFAHVEMLYRASTALITDYSSAFIDYLLTGKPAVSFAYDYESYLLERGGFYDLDLVFPGPICKSFTDLQTALDAVLQTRPTSRTSSRRRLFFDHVDDLSSARVVERIRDLNAVHGIGKLAGRARRVTQSTADPTEIASVGRPRLEWMDAMRGTAILLLLVWHASSIPVLFGVPMPEAIRLANSFFRPFRMPALMLLSGMLLSRSLAKPLPTYYARKLGAIWWPYLIWMLIARALFVDTDRMVWWHWRSWYATTYLWFLFFIGVYFLVAPLCRRLPKWSPVAAAFVLGVLLPQGGIEQRLAYFAFFFFAGHCFSSPLGARLLASRVKPRACAIVGVLLGIASMVWTDSLAYNTWTAPLSLCGIWAVIHFYSHGSRLGSSRPLGFLGRSSLVYYVSHFPVMMLVSQALLPVLPVTSVIVISLVSATAVSTVLALRQNTVAVSWLFRWPTWMSLVQTGSQPMARRWFSRIRPSR